MQLASPDNTGFFHLGGIYSSLSIKYSSQEYSLPSYLEKLQNFLGYELTRKDFLIPLLFTKPFGAKGKYGGATFGVLYNYSAIKYDYDKSPSNVVYQVVSDEIQEINEVPMGENSIHSYGGNLSAHLGYKHVFFHLGCAIYYQDYGTFNSFGSHQATFSGTTIVPSAGLLFQF